jgi:hypothetical protein
MNQDCISHLDRYRRAMNEAKCARAAGKPSLILLHEVCGAEWLDRHFDAVEVEAAERNPLIWIKRNPLDHSARGKLAKRKARF